MKRRNFIKSTAIIGSGITAVSQIFSCNPEEKKPEYSERVKESSLLKELENDYLKVVIFNDASTRIIDKKTSAEWYMGPVAHQDNGEIDEDYCWYRNDRTYMEQYPARFKVLVNGDVFEYIMTGRNNVVKGKFKCKITLDNEWLRYNLIEISESIPSLVFPTPVECESLVLPVGVGQLIKKKDPDIWYRRFYSFYARLNMQWIGGLKGEHAWMGVYEHPYDAGAMVVNSSVSPTWFKSLGKWNGQYTFKLKFIKGGYVDLAKTYRNYLIDNKRFKSLKEKIEANRELSKMAGGRLLSYFQGWPGLKSSEADDYLFTKYQGSWKNRKEFKVDFMSQEVLKSIEYAKTAGLKKGMVMLRGWINKGYDGSHPDIWPPDPRFGTIEDLKKLTNTGENIITSFHDNYQDMYEGLPSFPKGINIKRNGELMSGGFWAGGQAYILNSRNSVEYAKRNWEQTKTIGPMAMFIDTTSASYLLQSFEKGNLQTRKDDYENKAKLLEFYKKEGILVGSEEVAEFAAHIVDWFETRHSRTEGESIPLWPLVYHDTAYCSRYNSFDPGSPYPKWLEDMLWGYQLQFFMKPEFGNIRQEKASETVGFGANQMNEELFKSTFHVDEWHQRVGNSEMLNHKFLTDDFKVEETEFEGGAKIICNFGKDLVKIDNQVIPGYGYKILG